MAETRFNWSSIQQKNSFPTETLRFYQYGQLPAQQNARQPICDRNVDHNHFTDISVKLLFKQIFIFLLNMAKSGMAYHTNEQLFHGSWEEHRLSQTNFPWMVQLLIVIADF